MYSALHCLCQLTADQGRAGCRDSWAVIRAHFAESVFVPGPLDPRVSPAVTDVPPALR
jgi:hypothetical protein